MLGITGHDKRSTKHDPHDALFRLRHIDGMRCALIQADALAMIAAGRASNDKANLTVDQFGLWPLDARAIAGNVGIHFNRNGCSARLANQLGRTLHQGHLATDCFIDA
jgi:hypothetical protein